MAPHTPYFTTTEAADWLCFTGKHKVKHFLRFWRRRDMPIFERGRTLLVLKDDVVKTPKPRRRRRGSSSQAIPPAAIAPAISERSH